MTLAVTSLNANPPRFRATPIVNTGFVPNLDTHGSAGINNQGQIVYAFEDAEDVFRAFVWLPATDYGLAAQSIHIIPSLSTVTSNGDDDDELPTIARDINEAGIAVGQLDLIGRAIAWNLAGTNVPLTIYGTLDSSIATPLSAFHAINNDSPAIIVGDSAAYRLCACNSDEAFDTLTRAFKTEYASTPQSLVELVPSGNGSSLARDVNAASTVQTVGFTDCTGSEGGFCIPSVCFQNKNAVVWEGTTPNALVDLSGDVERFGRGINDAGDSVGYSVFYESNQCDLFATYWPDSGGIEDLSDYLPSGEQGEECRAEAINSIALPQIVGVNTDQGLARLWEKQGSGSLFAGTDLNATGVIACQTRWTLVDSHDINDNTWIVVTASRNTTASPYTSGDFYLLLLTPFNTCPADVNQDACVNVDDLLAVINNWGECNPGVFCLADMNGTTNVDVDDLNGIINGYCDDEGADCEEECCMNCPSCEESLTGGSSTSLEDLINATLASDIPSADQLDIIEILISHFG